MVSDHLDVPATRLHGAACWGKAVPKHRDESEMLLLALGAYDHSNVP